MLQLQIIGNLTRDAEIKTSEKTNNSFLTFTVAVNRGKDKPATFIRCMQRSSSYTDNVKPYMLKGKKVFVQGSIDVGIYTNNDRQVVADITCFVDSLQLLSSKEEGSAPTLNASVPPTNTVSAAVEDIVTQMSSPAQPQQSNEELPF